MTAATRAACFSNKRNSAGMHPDSCDDDRDEEWEDDPPGFDDYLSQCLETIESSQVPSQSQSVSASQETVVTGGDEETGETSQPIDRVTEADAISATGCVIDPCLQELDPKPDIEKLLHIFDDRFFEGALCRHGVSVIWSKHMTLSAGMCQFFPKTKRCIIKISIPLVREAERKNRVETLLHEMIHAHLFVTGQQDGHEEHGPLFTNHMARINTLGKCYITLRHTFDVKWRVWQCDGSCSNKPPHFGRLKRSSDRAPGPEDHWFQKHQETCGGVFQKVTNSRVETANPARSNKKGKKAKATAPPAGLRDIRNYYPVVGRSVHSPKRPAKSKDFPKPKVRTGSSPKSSCDKEAVEPEIITLD